MAEAKNVVELNSANLQTSSASTAVLIPEEPNTEPAAKMKPILLEESTRQEISNSLELLINKLYATTENHKEVTKHELIACLVYILMLEMGYTPVLTDPDVKINETFSGDVSFNMKRMVIFCQFARNWTIVGNNCIEMHFFLKPCEQTFDIIVTLSSFGAGITVNLIIMNNITKELEHLFPYFISTTKFILNHLAPVHRKFNNLRELSTDFKNKVAFPAKCAILNTDYKKHACLQYLPYEMQTKIAVFLPAASLVKCMLTCKHLSRFGYDQNLWKSLYLQLKEKPQKALEQEKSSDFINWKDLYKQCKGRRETRARTSTSLMDFYGYF